ncbi:hypothetical protein [Ignicoccus hospitalis]|uniref:WD-40 repeat protein n=1 Tax=Ignicoccus hospitalis (strain KIN4/I / DSM 18386 / JCM 14125) TaxID=453591 RepID=A8A9X1_IGNH4|nr:hypothetical protein [Ignicoccus hospitalis]ABU81723.1 hypothetical protein Igni_0541 [Ignicoccus hospitalis KIN4/I]HIH89987.1 hypothetical protein [Desulfurococcaceae archaeon]
MSLSLNELWNVDLRKRVNSLSVSEDGKVLAACDDGCAYLIENGRVLKKECERGSSAATHYKDGLFAVAYKNGVLKILTPDGSIKAEIKVGRYNEAIAIINDKSVVACSDACVKFNFDGERGWHYDIGGVGKNVDVENNTIYVPDHIWRKVHEVDAISGKGEEFCSCKEKVYSVDREGDLTAVGTTKSLIVFRGREKVWEREVGTHVTLVRVVGDIIFASNMGSQSLRAYDINGAEALNIELEGRPTALDARGKYLAVGFFDGKVKVYQLPTETEEERAEEAEVKEVEEAKEEVKETLPGLGEIKSVAEGSYMGTPLAKEILEEIENITETMEGAKNAGDLIASVIARVEKLTSVASSDWKQVYANYEEAERLLEDTLNVINEVKERIGEVESCPPPEKLIEILKMKSPKEFTAALAELAEGGEVAERVKKGVQLLKRCLERYYLLPSSEEVQKLEAKLKEVKEEKEAIKALIESGL